VNEVNGGYTVFIGVCSLCVRRKTVDIRALNAIFKTVEDIRTSNLTNAFPRSVWTRPLII